MACNVRDARRIELIRKTVLVLRVRQCRQIAPRRGRETSPDPAPNCRSDGAVHINGASAGGFSPLAIFGVITNGVVAKSNLPGNPLTLFLGSLFFNVLLNVVMFVIFGGRELLGRVAELEPVAAAESAWRCAGRRAGPDHGHRAGFGEPEHPPVTTLDLNRVLTLVVLTALAVGAMASGSTSACSPSPPPCCSLLARTRTRGGGPGRLADRAAGLRHRHLRQPVAGDRHHQVPGRPGGHHRRPLLAALVICYIGAGVSAFASTPASSAHSSRSLCRSCWPGTWARSA